MTRRPARQRAPARSRSGSGRCDTTTCVRDGGAGSTGYRTAPVGLRQTWEHPRDRVDRMDECIAVPQNATPGTVWLPNPPEQAGVTGPHARARGQRATAARLRNAAADSWELARHLLPILGVEVPLRWCPGRCRRGWRSDAVHGGIGDRAEVMDARARGGEKKNSRCDELRIQH